MRHWSEGIAKTYLLGLGYEILAENYRIRLGEIDLIAKDEMYFVFVEVKQRSSMAFGGARVTIDQRKLERMQRVALSFLVTHYQKDDLAMRFDAVLIQGTQARYKIEHLKAII